ncbi:MAG: hypothetical protein ACI9FZ_001184 [Bacteroidia bacterium]|jgi:hypothetical protein
MYHFFTQAFRQIAILLLCVLPLSNQAASTKEAPLDLSIIAQSDALRPYMTSPQRMAYAQASQLINQGQSDIRTGENLHSQKPSALNPNKDLKPLHERGKQLVEEGQAKVHSAQQQMIQLLTTAQARQTINQAIAAKKYNFELIEQTYPTALKQAAIQTLENCRNAGYANIFYDGLRIITAAQNSKAEPKVHNAIYDTFIQADGTQFSVKVPLGLRLEKDETTADCTFQYDNESAFEGKKVALLAIEVIVPGTGSEALLSVRALDLNTQRLISSVLFYIEDASEILSPATTATIIGVESTTGATNTPAPTARTIPASVSINDQNQLIEKLSGLATPYLFEIVTIGDSAAQSILVADLLKNTLLKNSALIIVEGDFIQRSYLPSAAFPSAATATLTITPNADDYTMIAKAHGSDRSLEIGTVTLRFPQ